jgi:hypothetical protein
MAVISMFALNHRVILVEKGVVACRNHCLIPLSVQLKSGYFRMGLWELETAGLWGVGWRSLRFPQTIRITAMGVLLDSVEELSKFQVGIR